MRKCPYISVAYIQAFTYLDDNMILCVRGRINVAKGHHTTGLVVENYHRKYYYGNHQKIHNYLWQKFAISSFW